MRPASETGDQKRALRWPSQGARVELYKAGSRHVLLGENGVHMIRVECVGVSNVLLLYTTTELAFRLQTKATITLLGLCRD